MSYSKQKPKTYGINVDLEKAVGGASLTKLAAMEDAWRIALFTV